MIEATDSAPRQLVLFGATGSVGRHVLVQALAQGHIVRAFARSAGSITHTQPTLHKVVGDVLDPDAVAAAVDGVDAVLVTLGNKSLIGKLRTDGTCNIVRGMETHGVRRLICQSTLGVGSSWNNLDFFWKYPMFSGLLRNVYADHVRQEDIVRQSTLDWTIVRPAAFTDGPRTDNYKHGFPDTTRAPSMKVSRRNIAAFMLEELATDHYLHRTPGLCD